MLLFIITRFTLNHAAQISSTPVVTKKEVSLPPDVFQVLRRAALEGKHAIPEPVTAWLAGQFPERNLTGLTEWSGSEIYLSLPRPGGDGWINIDRENGSVEWERTERGWVST